MLIEQEPEHFVNILQNLLELTSEETIEFSKLLNETPLPAMIKTTKIVSDRLKFLSGLRYMVYGDLAKTIRERSQLHKVLESVVKLMDYLLRKNLKGDIEFQIYFLQKSNILSKILGLLL